MGRICNPFCILLMVLAALACKHARPGANTASPIAVQNAPIEREVYLMGTSLHMIFYAQNDPVDQSEALIRIIEQTEDQLSTWRKTSELTRLNEWEVGIPYAGSESLYSLLKKTKKWAYDTSSAFDPSIGELLAVWGVRTGFRNPSPREIEGALSRSGMRHLNLDQGRIVKTERIRLDAGAFGKGEALDRALKYAEEAGFGPLLLDFGGQLASNSPPPNENFWEISPAHPVYRSAPTGLRIRFLSGSLATSGGSERDGTAGGKRISHILDPRSGYPAPSFGSVTVWHRSALAADVLSTALYVMGPQDGLVWATSRRIAACFQMVNGDRVDVRYTPEFENSLILE